MLSLGFLFLVSGAYMLIEGASALAKKFGVPSIIIGLTVVAFGTSAPELVIGIFSSLRGTSEIVFGNVIGANIADVLLVLGVSIVFSRVTFNKEFVKKEFPFLVYSAVLVLILVNDALFSYQGIPSISFFDGILLLTLFVLFMIHMKSSINREILYESFRNKDYKLIKAVFFVLLGPVALYFGGKFVVDNAILIAENLGLTQFVVSSTIVSFGTTLPELATAIMGIIKKQRNIVLGEVVGSLIFNVLFILGIASIINPIGISSMFNVNLLFFSIVNLFLVWVILSSKGHRISRIWGVLFLVSYLVYLVYNFFIF